MNYYAVPKSTDNEQSRYVSSSVQGNSAATTASTISSDAAKSAIERMFTSLKDAWVGDIMFVNSLSEINDSEALQAIIALGKPVLPYILRDLRDEPKHWFFALNVITGANPISPEDAGNVEKMRVAWLRWAAENHIAY